MQKAQRAFLSPLICSCFLNDAWRKGTAQQAISPARAIRIHSGLRSGWAAMKACLPCGAVAPRDILASPFNFATPAVHDAPHRSW